MCSPKKAMDAEEKKNAKEYARRHMLGSKDPGESAAVT